MNSAITSTGVFKSARGWGWLECCLDTLYYYHWFLEKRGIKVSVPIWKSHISIVRKNDEIEPDKLKPLRGEELEFNYDPHQIFFNGDYWWVDVVCPQAEKLRISLGLDPKPEYDFHLTLGKEDERPPGSTFGEKFRRD